MKKQLLSLLCFCLGVSAFGQTAAVKSYYSAANKEKAAQLKTALHKIITNHTERSYDQLWSDFASTDKRPDGTVWDMYSNITKYKMQGPDQGQNSGTEGKGYNREHSFPKSWFSRGKPMYSDLFHLYPTDTYVNGRRSNYPFGENEGEIYQTSGGFCKLGRCTVPGYSGIVFEPNDEYKGDFARTYFYMVTAYENRITKWNSAEGARATLDGKTYPGLSKWQLEMLMRWAKNDTVSAKERERNEAVYGIQGNRNPFIDYPGLEVYVWGDSVNVPVDLLAYRNPFNGKKDTTPIDSTKINPKDTTTVKPIETDTTSGSEVGSNKQFVRITSVDSLVVGKRYIIANDAFDVVLGASQGKYFERVSTPVEADLVNFQNVPDDVTILTLHKYLNGYAFELSTGGYLAYSSGNSLIVSKTLDEVKTLWNFTIDADGTHHITHVNSNRDIYYNSSFPRFAAYESAQKRVMLYIEDKVSGLNTVLAPTEEKVHVVVGTYDLSGRRVGKARGIVIRNGKKMIVR